MAASCQLPASRPYSPWMMASSSSVSPLLMRSTSDTSSPKDAQVSSIRSSSASMSSSMDGSVTSSVGGKLDRGSPVRRISSKISAAWPLSSQMNRPRYLPWRDTTPSAASAACSGA